MAPTKRSIGQEILEGLRQLKRREHGRVLTVPSVAAVREKTEGRCPPAAGDVAGRRVVAM